MLAQAGSSTEGVELAAHFADVVFTPQASLEAGIAFRDRVRAVAVKYGRQADAVRMLPGLSFVLGRTEAEASAAWRQLEASSSEEFRLFNLLHIAGIPLESFKEVDPDGPFPFHVFERAAGRTFAAAVKRSSIRRITAAPSGNPRGTVPTVCSNERAKTRPWSL